MSLGIIIPIVIFVGGICLAFKLTNIALAGLAEVDKNTPPQRKK